MMWNARNAVKWRLISWNPPGRRAKMKDIRPSDIAEFVDTVHFLGTQKISQGEQNDISQWTMVSWRDRQAFGIKAYHWINPVGCITAKDRGVPRSFAVILGNTISLCFFYLLELTSFSDRTLFHNWGDGSCIDAMDEHERWWMSLTKSPKIVPKRTVYSVAVFLVTFTYLFTRSQRWLRDAATWSIKFVFIGTYIQAMPSYRHTDIVGGDHMKKRLRVIVLNPGQKVLIVARKRHHW